MSYVSQVFICVIVLFSHFIYCFHICWQFLFIFIETKKTNTGEIRKRKNLILTKQIKTKIQKLEEENNKLKHTLQSVQKNFEKRLQSQADTLKCLIEDQKRKSKTKLDTKSKQLKTLRIKIKRKDSKIKDLLKVAKDTKMLSNTSYNILSNDFGESFSLFENEIKNQNKLPHGRRYSKEVKKFAVTLHYHSPKTYDYCRSAFSLFLTYLILIFAI